MCCALLIYGLFLFASPKNEGKRTNFKKSLRGRTKTWVSGALMYQRRETRSDGFRTPLSRQTCDACMLHEKTTCTVRILSVTAIAKATLFSSVSHPACRPVFCVHRLYASEEQTDRKRTLCLPCRSLPSAAATPAKATVNIV